MASTPYRRGGFASVTVLLVLASLTSATSSPAFMSFKEDPALSFQVNLLSLNDANNNSTDADISFNENKSSTDEGGSDAFFNHPSDHDSLIPLQMSDFIGFFVAALGLIIAAGGGIGGGGILVPVYILILGFLPKHAIPLSNVTVFGGAIANTLRNARKRHPTADRPLIDWDLIVVMEPPTVSGYAFACLQSMDRFVLPLSTTLLISLCMQLAGALIGANLNKMLSETVIAVMLVILLAITAYSTLKKARRMYQQETVDIRRQNVANRTVDVDDASICTYSKFESSNGAHEYILLNESNSDGEDEGDDLESNHFAGLSLHGLSASSSHHPPVFHHGLSSRSLSSVQLDEDANDNNENGFDDEETPEFGNPVSIEQILEQEKRPKRRNVILLVTMFGIVLVINILKGGGGFQSPLGIECGSVAFWLAQGLLLVWILFISWLGRRVLLKDAARKSEAGYIYLDEDLKWDRKSTVTYPLISTLAGFCAGKLERWVQNNDKIFGYTNVHDYILPLSLTRYVWHRRWHY